MTTPPGWPDEPIHPSQQGAPDHQSQPGHPGRQAYPGQQAYPGYPAQAGYPGYPGQPGGWPAASTDPLIPTDLGTWFGRVFGVIKRSFPRLTIIWIAPTAVLAAYLVAIGVAMPGQQELTAQIQSDQYATQDPAAAMGTAMELTVSRLLPIILVFLVVSGVVSILAQGASFHVIVNEANGRPGAIGEALRFAGGRALPLLGWTLVAGLITTVGFVLLIIPGLYLNVVIFASLFGVVIIERGNIGRCFQLIKGRFWVTTGRLLMLMAATIVYSIALGVLVFLVTLLGGLTGLTGAMTAVSGILQAVLTLPLFVLYVAAFVVTYAELRYRENSQVTTATLAAELTRA